MHMLLTRSFPQSFRYGLTYAALTVFLSFTAAAQVNPTQPSPEDAKKLAVVAAQFAQLSQKLRARVELPMPRHESRLLPLLAESTLAYVAIPNYGEASHQALAVFREELKTNEELRAWWQKGDMATEGPKIEDRLEKFYELSQYLGDEIVVMAASEGKGDPKFLLLSEVRKPGLKTYLQGLVKEISDKPMPEALVFDANELSQAKNVPADEPIILIRDNLVMLGQGLDTLRQFSAQLQEKNFEFASTSFGKRLIKCYHDGATIIAAADMHAVLSHIPKSAPQSEAIFERTGFSDMDYVVWEHKNIAGQPASQMELSFLGPRRGIASWLAAPGPMGSLEFISPKAVLSASLLLKDPAQIYDDVAELATASNPNAMASLAQMESALQLSLRNDILARLTGEITVEVDTLPPQAPVWKVFLKAKDPSGLSSTLQTLFTAMRVSPAESDEDGVAYHTLTVPSGQKMLDITYAMADGYMIVGSGRRVVSDAIQLRRTGGSLAKSSKLISALPPSHTGKDVSALIYEDPMAIASFSLRISPELASSLSSSTLNTPLVIAGYGEETVLREANRSGGVDVGVALMLGAIAIPNLLRARTAANDASAVANLRTANIAQITYQSTYPRRGYAHDLASLGPDPSGSHAISSQHASLIDPTLGGASCTAGAWCIKSGYRFTITTTCKLQPCSEYVVVATPVSSNTGTRNLCSTSDAVIRSEIGPPLTSPISAARCRSWAPFMQ